MKTHTHTSSLLIGLLLAGCAGGLPPVEVQKAAQVASLVVTDSPSYDFGSQLVDSRIDKTFTVTNVGLKDATDITSSFNLSVNFSYTGGTYPGEGGTCGSLLSMGSSCQVVVRLKPKYIGVMEEVLKITFNNGLTQQTTSAPQLKAKGVWDAAGSSDLTLAPQGRIFYPLSGGDDFGRAILTLSDGKLLMAGSSGENTYVQRLLADGEVDTSFSTQGRRTFSLGSGIDSVRALAMTTDGKLVVAGRKFESGIWKTALARLNSDGTDDVSWGTGGRVLSSLLGADWMVESIAVMPDRAVVVAGSRVVGGLRDVTLARFLPNGSPDNSFGVAGVVTSIISANDDEATSLIVIDNKILVGGRVDRDFLLLRYDWDGQLDSTFGNGGIVTLDLESDSVDRANVLRVQADRKILLGGYSLRSMDTDFAVARFLSTGALDTSFGTNGKTIVSLGNGNDEITAAAIQSDKKLVFAGRSGLDLGLVRLLPTGLIDPLFGTNGKAILSFGSDEDRLNGMALQSNGKYLLVGESYNGNDFDPFLSRVWP